MEHTKISSVHKSSQEVEGNSANVPSRDENMPTLSPICTPCQNLFRYFPSLRKQTAQPYTKDRVNFAQNLPFFYHKNVLSIQSSVDLGCSVCTQISRSNNVRKLKDGLNWPLVSIQLFPTGQISWTMMLLFSTPGSSSRENFASSYLDLRVKLVPAPKPISSQILSHNTRRSMRQATSWLHKCINYHHSCENNNEKRIPTRLVSIEKSKTCLVLGSQIAGHPKYATLSHRWGDAKFVTLQKSNLEGFKDEIPTNALSKTFRDAIEIARELSIAFIWIDSLCILQDVANDWSHEAALMASVYGGSSLNIAASGASDGNVGCFLPDEYASRAQVLIKNYKGMMVYECVPDQPYAMLSDMPLLRRGWVLQERVLAPRTLHFTTSQIFWECNQMIACETFPRQLPPEITQIDSTVKNDKVVRARVYYEKQPVNLAIWPWLVETYSGCKLTQPGDKLVAFSGVCREIQRQTNDEYIAGMWRTNLERHLCWASRKKNPKYPDFIAPSWSWMSINGSVHYAQQESPADIWIQVLKVAIVTTTQDSFGQILRASLHVSCDFLFHGTYHQLPENLDIGGHLYDHVLKFDHDETNRGESQNGRIHNSDLHIPIILMPIMVRGNSTIARDIFALVLEATSVRGQYRRIGCCDGMFIENFFAHLSNKSYVKPDFLETMLQDGSLPLECLCKDTDYAQIFKDDTGKVRKVIELV